MKLIWYQYSNFACTNVHTTDIQISKNYENLVFTPLATKVTYLRDHSLKRIFRLVFDFYKNQSHASRQLP